MNALAIYAVNEHLSMLMAEAHAERMARKARKAQKRRGLLASILNAARSTQAPTTPTLAAWPRS